ncbi:FecR family protein [bacterium A37T11]|nr:FecR family protein [bacterium A37T11]
MNNEEIRILLSKYQAGTLSDEERAILESWYLSTVKNASVTISDQDLQFNLKAVEKVIISGTRPGRPSSRSLWVSAALILLIGTGLLFVVSKKVKPESVKEEIVYVAPGRDQATLKLSNGKKIDLNGEKKGIVVANNEIAYNDGSKVEETKSTHFELSTPKGGQYRVVLPDGTKVWLNAASSLRYPATFDPDKREVELVFGEAYFEVASRAQSANLPPFIVKSNGLETIVLGTAFNISAYKEDAQSAITLVNGKVKVSANTGKKNEVILKPGQETVETNRGLVTRDADIPSVIGWKEGLFKFNETELQAVMNQLSRWYNLEVEYRGTIKETYIYGVIKRNKPLDEVLNILKEGGVNVKIESSSNGTAKKVIVYPAIL